jgi:hypothetical protein
MKPKKVLSTALAMFMATTLFASAQAKPDLVVSKPKLIQKGVCKPNNMLYTFSVKVTNKGKGIYVPTSGKASVNVYNTKVKNWGNGAIIPKKLKPGQSIVVKVPVYYLNSNPDAVNKPFHKFYAIADALKLSDESNEGNNKSKTVKIKSPCSLKKKPDIIVKNVFFKREQGQNCRVMITLKNMGGDIPLSQFNNANVSLTQESGVRGTYPLNVLDRNKRLAKAGGQIVVPWNAILIKPGSYKFGAIADSNNAIVESNENNNEMGLKSLGCLNK